MKKGGSKRHESCRGDSLPRKRGKKKNGKKGANGFLLFLVYLTGKKPSSRVSLEIVRQGGRECYAWVITGKVPRLQASLGRRSPTFERTSLELSSSRKNFHSPPKASAKVVPPLPLPWAWRRHAVSEKKRKKGGGETSSWQ